MIVTLPAGVSQNITVAGARFYFVDGNGKINVRLKGSGDSRDFDLYPRQGVNSDVRFAGVEVTNISDEEQTIEFEISDREVFDNRIPEVAQVEPVGGAMSVVPQGGFMPVMQADFWNVTNGKEMPLFVASGEEPIRTVSAPVVRGWLRAKGLITPGSVNPPCVGFSYPFVGRDYVFRVSGISVNIRGNSLKTKLVVGYGVDHSVSAIPNLQIEYAEFSRLSENPQSVDLRSSEDIGFSQVHITTDNFRVIEEMYTESSSGVRNVYFDLTGREFEINNHSGLWGYFGVYVASVDGSPIYDESSIPEIVVNLFGEAEGAL